ncbi:MAG: chalcone isomerase family protein [Myxococcota bacterium]
MNLIATLLFCGWAEAATLAGVTLPDQATVGGQSLVLNGIGLREKYFFDIYVGGLYLKTKTTNANDAIQQEAPKRIVMHFVRSLDKATLSATLADSINNSPQSSALQSELVTFKGWIEDVSSGDEITLDYVPGTGTTVTIKGNQKGVIQGSTFMTAIWSIFIGPSPASTDLKNGMLGL